jgi:hypothetical protein
MVALLGLGQAAAATSLLHTWNAIIGISFVLTGRIANWKPWLVNVSSSVQRKMRAWCAWKVSAVLQAPATLSDDTCGGLAHTTLGFRVWSSRQGVSVWRMCTVAQWLRLAVPKGPNRVGDSLFSPEDGNRSSLQNDAFSSYLEFRTMNRVQERSEYENSIAPDL